MRVIRVFFLVLLGAVVLLCFAWAIATLYRGDYVTAAVAAAVGLFWFIPFLIWSIMPTVVARVSHDQQGTVVRPDWRIDALTLCCVIVGVVALGLFGVLGLIGQLDIPLPRDIAVMYTPIFIVAAVILLVSLGFMARRRGVGYVRLTAEGFEFAETYRTKRGAWSEVIEVSGEARDHPKAKSPLAMRMLNGKDQVLYESALYTPGGRALLQVVRFYWRHPENHSELTDGRAGERLQTLEAQQGTGVHELEADSS